MESKIANQKNITVSREPAANNLPATQGADSEYKVGNKHPPKEHQFKPGQSGNPLGGKIKPRSQRELEKLLDEIFDEEVKAGKKEKETLLKNTMRRLIKHKQAVGPMYVVDRRFGRVPQKMRLEGGGEPIVVRLVLDNGRNESIDTEDTIVNSIAEEISQENDTD